MCVDGSAATVREQPASEGTEQMLGDGSELAAVTTTERVVSAERKDEADITHPAAEAARERRRLHWDTSQAAGAGAISSPKSVPLSFPTLRKCYQTLMKLNEKCVLTRTHPDVAVFPKCS